MVNVIKAVESLREFQTYWINASEEDKKMFFAVLNKDHEDYEKIMDVLQSHKEESDEYFPYEWVSRIRGVSKVVESLSIHLFIR